MDIGAELGLPEFLKTDAVPIELNFYGAAKMVADRLGINNPPVSYVSWMHGWRYDLIRADQWACDAHIGLPGHPDGKFVIPIQRRRPFLVSNRKLERMLQEAGYDDSRAVGLPFTYVERDPSVQRMPGSLLVMPSHVLINMPGRANEIEYLEYIRTIAPAFKRVVFCINLACLANGMWLDNLKKYGFDYIFGAGMMDQNALFRMRRIFDSFEYMTSNGIGSHHIYAGLCGVKVSLAGPLDNCRWDMFKNEPAWQDPVEREKLIHHATMYQHDQVRQLYPWLYVEPHHGVNCLEWSQEETGLHHKVSFEELAILFGWRQRPGTAEVQLLPYLIGCDERGQIPEMVQHLHNVTYHPATLTVTLLQLLNANRLRPAYILAMLLFKRQNQHAAVAFALSVGGILFRNPSEMENGLQCLQPLLAELPPPQQSQFLFTIVRPILIPLLANAIGQANEALLQQLLEIGNRVLPAQVAAEPADVLQQARLLLERVQRLLPPSPETA
ncbi:MAG: hypothetical protein HQM06_14245 [Magnetococcales bacterium]|nr:hypothetical protein [Magnetococcales bacterium]